MRDQRCVPRWRVAERGALCRSRVRWVGEGCVREAGGSRRDGGVEARREVRALIV